MTSTDTEEIMRNKAEIYCAAAERCLSDVTSKLIQWGASPEAMERILSHLLEERYLDEKRYAQAFVRDKYRFNGWGRLKIAMALRQKGIPNEPIDAGLNEIDEREYRQTLKALLQRKRKTVKGKTAYEQNGKLIRLALGKGYEMNEILRVLKQPTDEDSLE
ncbi:regulatory protein RecX [Bacteroidetes bacterium oral taxon 272 str. F0290]|uniref:regulatory protein RecX n=1 Tax=Phocaeicola abscessus TaxID=555313 RepID=UPI0003855E68|nr:regulatory protein RecX [Phocaeicola abscessus]EPT33349.1 regulatory protein RecX [Bacteroidetes bacterium oral taxon 272 str. F0290]